MRTPLKRRSKRLMTFESLDQRWNMDAGAAALANFSYPNQNPASDNFNEAISPREFLGQVSGWYFAHAGCVYCGSQFGKLDEIQTQLDAEYPLLKIDLGGVNEAGFASPETGQPTITIGRTLPWVQDVDTDGTAGSDIWTAWGVTFRDLVILDSQNEKVLAYNLTTHDLTNPTNFNELKQLLIDTAMAEQRVWQNATKPADVDHNGVVTPLDALLLINELNVNGGRILPAPTGATIAQYWDASGDGAFSQLDALTVINYLNTNPPAGQGGEGEAASAASTSSTDDSTTLDWCGNSHPAAQSAPWWLVDDDDSN